MEKHGDLSDIDDSERSAPASVTDWTGIELARRKDSLVG
jgi:hypothetical protein